ncbi:hypothetical protein EU546_08295, partial [Candidatus Thorarchaeota archaeon]
MINEIVKLADEIFKEKLSDPTLVRRMDFAREGQSPEYMLISPIDRSLQDLELLSLLQGEAFHGSRVPGLPLLPVEKSLFLYGGPISYNSGFPKNRAIILTFDKDEDSSIINTSVKNLIQHPGARSVPVVCLRVDYDEGTARPLHHNGPRDLGVEAELLKGIKRPTPLDAKVLVTVCSDSRVRPPPTPSGLPMAIQSLGGHVPAYTGGPDETGQLDSFFREWFEVGSDDNRILVFGHGSFDCEGPTCGAGKACMHAESIEDPILGRVIRRLDRDASALEDKRPETPESRV